MKHVRQKGYWEAWTDERIKDTIDHWKKVRVKCLQTGKWRVEDIPFYEPGRPSRADLWHKVDYLDEYDMIWGKKWGASGIGKLREMAVVRPTEADIKPFVTGRVYSTHPWLCMPSSAQSLPTPTPKDLENWQREHDLMVQLLREQGVTVHYIEYPEEPIGAYGPLGSLAAASEITVIWGGAIVPRFGFNPFSKGRERVLTQWLVKQGCPILLTITGKGICETGVILYLADDCAVVGRGLAFNEEGISQIRPVMERAGITTILEVHYPGWLESTRWPAGGMYHHDMFMATLDLGKVLLYPPFVGWETIKWLRDRGFELIEIQPDEQRDHVPANLIVLEPGKVMMHAEAKETIKKVKKAGVEVIEVPSANSRLKIGRCGGLDCLTLYLVRDRGPKLEDIC